MGRVTYLYYLPRRNRYLAGRIIAADNAPTPSMLIVSYNNTVREKSAISSSFDITRCI